MPVVTAARFDQMVDKYYAQLDEQLHDPAYDFLDNSGLRKNLEGFLNKMLTAMATEATKAAVKSRTMVVMFTINTAKAAQKFYAKLSPDWQQRVPLTILTIAIELLLEEQGFLVENHTLKYERTILPDTEPPEVVPPAPPAPPPTHRLPIGPHAAHGAIGANPRGVSSAPIPPVPSVEEPEMDVEEDDGDDGPDPDEEDLDQELAEIEAQQDEDDADATAEDGEHDVEDDDSNDDAAGGAVEVGMIFGNGRGIHRKVDAIESGHIKYTVIQGKGSVKAGATGDTTYKAFLSWAKERIAS